MFAFTFCLFVLCVAAAFLANKDEYIYQFTVSNVAVAVTCKTNKLLNMTEKFAACIVDLPS